MAVIDSTGKAFLGKVLKSLCMVAVLRYWEKDYDVSILQKKFQLFKVQDIWSSFQKGLLPLFSIQTGEWEKTYKRKTGSLTSIVFLVFI